MSNGPMAWWYWFGMWIAGITGLVIAWWLIVDAYRAKAGTTRFVWPLAAVAGILLQLPAFAVLVSSPTARSTTPGTVAAVVGVAGTVLLGIAAVSYFTSSGGQGSSSWSSHTRDQRTGTSDQSVDRRRREPARASVPISKLKGQPAPQATPAAAKQPGVTPDEGGKDGGVAAAAPHKGISDDAFIDLQGEPGVTEVEEPTGTSPSDLTIGIDRDETIVDEIAPTLVDEPGATVLEDEDGAESGAQLVVTGGTSSRIIVTERSGPFRVGRDPSKANLAVDDGRVSRVHFVVDRIGDQFVLSDHTSSNGTYVNGSAVIEPRALQDGDVIEFGRTIATFTLPVARKR